jgi:hypothetical protein
MSPKNNIHKQEQSAVQCSEDSYHCEMTQADMRWSGRYLNLFTPANDIMCQLHIYASSQHLQPRSGKSKKKKMHVLQLYEVQDFHKCWVKNINYEYYLHISYLEENHHSQQHVSTLLFIIHVPCIVILCLLQPMHNFFSTPHKRDFSTVKETIQNKNN